MGPDRWTGRPGPQRTWKKRKVTGRPAVVAAKHPRPGSTQHHPQREPLSFSAYLGKICGREDGRWMEGPLWVVEKDDGTSDINHDG